MTRTKMQRVRIWGEPADQCSQASRFTWSATPGESGDLQHGSLRGGAALI